MAKKTSGQEPFRFSLCDDLYTLPERARPHEVDLHGGFADDTAASGYLYYGMPGCGIMRISADLTAQEIIELPSDLKPINFHSTKIIEFDGKRRLVLPANNDAKVAVVGLDGNVDYILSRPEFEEYRDEEVLFKPTDTAFADGTLYVSDGYGANYISSVDPSTHTTPACSAARPTIRTRTACSGPRTASIRPPTAITCRSPTARTPASSSWAWTATSTPRTRSPTAPSRAESTSSNTATAGTPWSAALTTRRKGARRRSTSWTATPTRWLPPSAPRKIWASSWPTTSTTPSGTSATGRST